MIASRTPPIDVWVVAAHAKRRAVEHLHMARALSPSWTAEIAVEAAKCCLGIAESDLRAVRRVVAELSPGTQL